MLRRRINILRIRINLLRRRLNLSPTFYVGGLSKSPTLQASCIQPYSLQPDYKAVSVMPVKSHVFLLSFRYTSYPDVGTEVNATLRDVA